MDSKELAYLEALKGAWRVGNPTYDDAKSKLVNFYMDEDLGLKRGRIYC